MLFLYDNSTVSPDQNTDYLKHVIFLLNALLNVPHVYYKCDIHVIYVWCFRCITCNSYTCNTCMKDL